jgi:hypothetical protein
VPIYDVRSISQVGTVEPFELQVARGQIPGHSNDVSCYFQIVLDQERGPL